MTGHSAARISDNVAAGKIAIGNSIYDTSTTDKFSTTWGKFFK